MNPQDVVSVAGLTDYIQFLLQEDPQLQRIWVTGEVSSVNDHPSGLFFTLSDRQQDAAIQCVVWKSLRNQLIQTPQRGEEIIVLGSLRVYGKRGDYRLMVFQCLATGEGLQALRYQQRRARLQAEGLFDIARKRPLPLYPRTIAVVTSPAAAAWGDIQRTLTQRDRGLHLLLSPAMVQGEKAPDSIVAAIERVNRDQRAEVLILARGGGATEDLSCFDDERVIRAIAESAIPVVTGIGHQRDESLADLVADLSVHTPTAAAEAVVPAHSQLLTAHHERVERLVSALQQRVLTELNRVEQLKTRLKRFPAISPQLLHAQAQCQLLEQKLLALDPQGVLQRGYAVVRDENGQIVRSPAELSLDQALTIQLKQGSIAVKVSKKSNPS